jgi:hypothetical protein
MSKVETALSWGLQIVVAVILFQTLFFKFTGAEESVFIFSALGVEPWGRIASGVAELIAVALILYPSTAVLGALLSLGVISGALASHAILGISVRNDGGLLFLLAVIVFVSSAAVVYLRRVEIPVVGSALVRSTVQR